MFAVPDEEYLTVAEAAAFFRVSQSTIWRWINAEELRAYRIGHRRIRVRRADLAQLITPARKLAEKGGRTEKKEVTSLGRLTSKEQKQMLSAIEGAKRFQEKLLRRRNGEPFPSSTEILDELRAERTRGQH